MIELMAVIAVGTVILGVAVTLLYALLRTEGSARDLVRRGAVLSRLADQFRRDVHAAIGGGNAEPAPGWQFELGPDWTVSYRIQPGMLVRTEHVDAAVRRQESFALPPGTTASIEIQADSQPTIATLLITPLTEASPTANAPEASGQPLGRTIRIDAVLAKDHCVTKRNEPSSEDLDE